MDTPFGWENNDVDAVAFSDTRWDKFFMSGTERKLSDKPSLEANDMDSGDVWSKEPTKSVDWNWFIRIHYYLCLWPWE